MFFNKVVSEKWLWRFRIEEHALWRKLIAEMCEILKGVWKTKNIAPPVGCGIWGNIYKMMERLHRQHNFHIEGSCDAHDRRQADEVGSSRTGRLLGWLAFEEGVHMSP